MAKRRAVVIAPGRGTYNKGELGYLARHHQGQHELIAEFDRRRAELGQPGLSALDSAGSYSAATLTRGDNASGLIYACSLADFMAIDRERFDVVAVTGNSMGWYSALACSGALDASQGFDLVNAMGTRMHEQGVGGQVIHTTLDEDWQPLPGRREELLALRDAIPDLHVSIELGGMIVFAGTDAALAAFTARAPVGPGRFPLRLGNHAAFHSPLLTQIASDARQVIPASWFRQPDVPLIDGRGQIWRPHMTDLAALWRYTLDHQIVRAYDFTRAVTVAAREFAPDCLIILGPGDTLGGAVLQSLIAARWRGWESKAHFERCQADARHVLAMGRQPQRVGVVSKG